MHIFYFYIFWGGWGRVKEAKINWNSYSGRQSQASLLVSRKERGTVLEGSHLLQTPLPNLSDKSCCTLRGLGSWAYTMEAHKLKAPPGVVPNTAQRRRKRREHASNFVPCASD